MKKQAQVLLATGIGILSLGLGLLPGCSSQQLAAGNGVLISGVNASMAAWSGYVSSKINASNPPSVTLNSQIITVSNAYNIYYTSELVASNASFYYAQNPTNASLSANALTATKALVASETNLVTLINSIIKLTN